MVWWLLCLCHCIAYSQSGTINGSVQFPASPENVVIQLLSAKDKVIMKTAIPEADGTFGFSGLAYESYIVTIDDAKFVPFQSEVIAISPDSANVTFPPIVLLQSPVNEIKEVVVQKKLPIVENKIDRTVVNVDAILTAAGGDAMDVLEKSPGIVVDQNGTITYKGKSGLAVFIDDKPTYLSGSELEAYLKSLPASTLSQIELMTNPPAKYDAAGSAGVINIVTKKSKSRGFNGSISSRFRQGKRTGTQQSLNLNYVNDKLRIFGNIGYGLQQSKNDLYIYRRFKNEDLTTKSYFDQYSNLTGRSNATNARLGIDYYASEKTTFGIGVSGMIRSGKRNSDVESILSNAAFVIDSTIIADNTNKTKFSNVGVNLNFRRDLQKGRKITADADYLNYHDETNQQFRNYVYQPDNSLSSQDESIGNLPSRINIFSLKTDYTHPLKNDGRFEAGYKASFSKTDNIADYRDVENQMQFPNYDMSNHFKYEEIINAVYANFNSSYRRFSFQTGLRLENTESKGHQLGNIMKPASEFRRNYTNLFPTAYVSYSLDSIGNNKLVATYGKRIDRPYFQDLNPFISPLDKFTFYSGNPFLNPSFSHNVELSYRYKSLFSTAVSYGSTKDNIDETIEINNGIYYSRPGNIGKSRVFMLNANAEIPFAKWLTTSIYSEVNYSEYKSKLYSGYLNSSGTYWSVFATNIFRFVKDWSAELSGMYQTEVTSAQFVLGPRGNINVAIQKKIFKGQGSLKIMGNDIFQGNIYKGTINNLYLTDATWVNKPDSRSVALVFTYSFGKTFQSKAQYNATGADSEKNRVKVN